MFLSLQIYFLRLLCPCILLFQRGIDVSSRNYNAIHDALYRGYFVDGRNIGDEDTLVDIATNIGLPKDEVKAVLADRSHKNAVDADWAKSREYGVTGVPTFVAGGYSLVGAQPYEMLQQMMDQIKTSATESSP